MTITDTVNALTMLPDLFNEKAVIYFWLYNFEIHYWIKCICIHLLHTKVLKKYVQTEKEFMHFIPLYSCKMKEPCIQNGSKTADIIVHQFCCNTVNRLARGDTTNINMPHWTSWHGTTQLLTSIFSFCNFGPVASDLSSLHPIHRFGRFGFHGMVGFAFFNF